MAGIIDIFKGITSGLAGPVVDYMKQRQELKSRERIRKEELKEAHHERNLKLAELGLTADMNWEMTFANQAANSWKDEYTLIVVSIPAILAFVQFTAWGYTFDGPAIVASGFSALSGTPFWYQVLLGTMFGATVGVRWWRRSQYDTENAHESYFRFMGPVAPLQPKVLRGEADTPVSDPDNKG